MRFLPIMVALALAVAGTPASGRTNSQVGVDLPSRPGVDAPELARLGRFFVGVRSIRLAVEPGPGGRHLEAEVWYPARPGPRAPGVVYSGELPREAPGQWSRFTIPGLAARDAPVARDGPFPLIVLSHGYSGTPVAMSWVAENLASKGYVVVGPHHEDPPITDPAGFPGVAARRPLDVAGTAREVLRLARSNGFLHELIDPQRVALIGYSMGGYGALTVAGAGLAPDFASAKAGGLRPYARGGDRRDALRVPGVRAVVGISPAGGGGGFAAWGATGLADLRLPTLLIVGDHDQVVGYSPGVRTIFDQAVNARRYLLIFKDAGHSIGMDGAPAEMRGSLWDLDWFEDPVWRKSRVLGVSLHMITAFLDLYVKGDKSRAAYLEVIPEAEAGAWPTRRGAYDAYSPGVGDATVWKGFQRRHVAGLELLRAGPPAP